MDEAPSRNTSICCRPVVGRALTLTDEVLNGSIGKRRPLRRMSVLAAPKPRRAALALSPRAATALSEDSLAGMLVISGMPMSKSIDVAESRVCSSDMLNTVTGRVFSWSRRLMLEPVVTNASMTMVSVLLPVAGSVVWALTAGKSVRPVRRATLSRILGWFGFIGLVRAKQGILIGILRGFGSKNRSAGK